MKYLCALLAALSLIALPCCQRRTSQAPSDNSVVQSPQASDEDELLPPPEGSTPKPRPSGKSDQTLKLLADICKQQQTMQQHIQQMDENNQRGLALLGDQKKKLASIETAIPQLDKKIDAHAQRFAVLEERLRVTEELVRIIQDQSPRSAAQGKVDYTEAIKPPAPAPAPKGDNKKPPAEDESTAGGAALARVDGANPGQTEKPLQLSSHAQQLRAQVRAAYNKLLVDFPKAPEAGDALLGLAVMSEEEQDWTGAIKHYESLLKSFSNLPVAVEARFNLARAKARIGAKAEAREQFILFADTYPRHRLYVPALLAMAECLAETNVNDALREYRSVERAYKDTTFAQTAREKMADLLMKSRRYPEAIVAYKAAIDPLSAQERQPLEIQLARAQIANGEVAAARQGLEELRTKARHDKLGWDIRWNLGLAYEEDEKPLDAARTFVTLANDFSDIEDTHRARLRAATSFLASELAGHSAEEAKKVLAALQSAELPIKNELEPEALFTLARAASLSGNVAEAKDRLAELRRLFPNHPLVERADAQEAEALAASGKLEEAVALLRQTILRRPNAPAANDALLRIAELQERSGNASRGAGVYAELLNFTTEEGQKAAFKLRRGILLQSLGQSAQAREVFNRVLADTEAPKALSALATYQIALLDQSEGKLAAAISGYEKFTESSSGGIAVLGVDISNQVEDARFKISKLKLISESREQASVERLKK